MTTPLSLLIAGWSFAAVLMVVLFFIQYRTSNATLVDLGWSGTIALLALVYAAAAGGNGWAWLAGLMGTLWGIRLTAYLYFDRMRGRPEDGRYRHVRERWAPRTQFYFFIFFQAQAFLAVLFSVPILLAILHVGETGFVWRLLGLAIWMISVCGETVADIQLNRFKQDPNNRGKTCRAGLWNTSRHPNYFFEWLHWWSYVLLTLGSWAAWVNLLFPLVMLFFLFKVTGIPATEEQALRSRGKDYREYQRTTSVFVPWVSRSRAPSNCR